MIEIKILTIIILNVCFYSLHVNRYFKVSFKDFNSSLSLGIKNRYIARAIKYSALLLQVGKNKI